MEEKQKAELMGLMGRMERLRRLMGQDTPQMPAAEKGEEEQEKLQKILLAAIPFLDQEYQRDLYIAVRFMEMQQMLAGGMLQARSRESLPSGLRRRQMLRAIRPCLSPAEQNRLDTLVRVMEAGEILAQKEALDGNHMDKSTNAGAGRGTAAADPRGPGKKQR